MNSANRRCKQCRKKVPADSAFVSQLRAFCSYECLTQFTKSECGKNTIIKSRKKETRARKEKLKTRSDYMREAVQAFNAYIRWRDRDDACISCGNFSPDDVFGGSWDAGHFRSRGSAPQLTFRQDNVHKQCVKCNRFLSGNAAEYRKRLIHKIGADRVDELERTNGIEGMRFNQEYLTRIRDVFRKKLRIKKKMFALSSKM